MRLLFKKSHNGSLAILRFEVTNFFTERLSCNPKQQRNPQIHKQEVKNQYPKRSTPQNLFSTTSYELLNVCPLSGDCEFDLNSSNTTSHSLSHGPRKDNCLGGGWGWKDGLSHYPIQKITDFFCVCLGRTFCSWPQPFKVGDVIVNTQLAIYNYD